MKLETSISFVALIVAFANATSDPDISAIICLRDDGNCETEFKTSDLKSTQSSQDISNIVDRKFPNTNFNSKNINQNIEPVEDPLNQTSIGQDISKLVNQKFPNTKVEDLIEEPGSTVAETSQPGAVNIANIVSNKFPNLSFTEDQIEDDTENTTTTKITIRMVTEVTTTSTTSTTTSTTTTTTTTTTTATTTTTTTTTKTTKTGFPYTPLRTTPSSVTSSSISYLKPERSSQSGRFNITSPKPTIPSLSLPADICKLDDPIRYLVPHPTDCNKFVSCQWLGGKRFKPNVMSCPSTTGFDNDLSICNFGRCRN